MYQNKPLIRLRDFGTFQPSYAEMYHATFHEAFSLLFARKISADEDWNDLKSRNLSRGILIIIIIYCEKYWKVMKTIRYFPELT